ncbi:hypothetical protein [Mesorhizobium sophorae]|uniref:hypothetical protein n=1 Tax=Mesorhizobium sophorae TaxID=1300294 RepID=UPI000BA3781F|nr:hypothetical protein [Mesorhizobium sophorae]
MQKFWESSPEWQRQEEFFAALKAAEEAQGEAGRGILSCVRLGILDGPVWESDRAAYLLAHETFEDAFMAWSAARTAFWTSTAGQAEARFLADPIAFRASESEAA